MGLFEHGTRNDIVFFWRGKWFLWMEWADLFSDSLNVCLPLQALWRHLLLGNLARDEISPEGAFASSLFWVVPTCSKPTMIHGSVDFNWSLVANSQLKKWPNVTAFSLADQPNWRELLRVLDPCPAGTWDATAACGTSSGEDLLGRCAARVDWGELRGKDPDMFGYGHESDEIANYNW